MAYVKQFQFTKDGSAHTESLGVTTNVLRTYNKASGDMFIWSSAMPDNSSFHLNTSGYGTSNGGRNTNTGALFGAPITAVTKGATTTFTASYIDLFSISEGDVLVVTQIAGDNTGTSLNGEYTVSSVTATQVVCSKNTSAGYEAYVSGGVLVRKENSSGVPVSTANKGISGVVVGTALQTQAVPVDDTVIISIAEYYDTQV